MQKGAIPKACKNTQKRGKEGRRNEKKGAIKQAEKLAKSQPAEGCNQGAIRVQLGCNQGAKGRNPKSLQKHAKTGKREGEDEKKGAIKQAEKQAKSQPAEGCNQGAIRVQLGCNQGAKGCNPKSVQKHAKTGPVGRASINTRLGASTERRLGEPVSNLNGLGEPVLKRGWANQYLKTNPPGPVRRTIEKKIRNPSRPVGQTIEKRNPSRPVGRTSRAQKGATQKSLQKTHKKQARSVGARGLAPKTSKKTIKKQAKSQPAEGAIRVQLGCNQGAIRVQKGATPKSCKNTQKHAQLGKPVLILHACSALLSACSAPPTGACSAPPTRCLPVSTSYSVLA